MNFNKLKKIPVTAFVVVCNEEKYLEKCLNSISFCNEIIVLDLESTDESVKIAEQCGAKVINHPRVPVVEIIHSKIENYVANNWVLITDPDEVTDWELANELVNMFEKNSLDISKIGSIVVPWKFYFREKPLSGTVWGGIKSRVLIANLTGFTFSASVHNGRKLKHGFSTISISNSGNNLVHHYWMSNYVQLINKHRRYIRREGMDRYERGKRFNLLKLVYLVPREFRRSFVLLKGYKDGITGLFLSVFWVWYSISCEISLLKYQMKMNRN